VQTAQIAKIPTSNTQEPKGSIVSAFAVASGSKKNKNTRAPPQPAQIPKLTSVSTGVEHSANNGHLSPGDAEHSIDNLSQIPEKTQEFAKT
jgi:hypothetical protein